MKFLLLLTFVALCSASTLYKNKNISVHDDGSIFIAGPGGNQVIITGSIGLNGLKYIQIIVSGPTIPTKTIQISDQQYGLTGGEGIGFLQGILTEYQGIVDESQYEQLLTKVLSAVQQGKISQIVYNLLQGLSLNPTLSLSQLVEDVIAHGQGIPVGLNIPHVYPVGQYGQYGQYSTLPWFIKSKLQHLVPQQPIQPPVVGPVQTGLGGVPVPPGGLSSVLSPVQSQILGTEVSNLVDTPLGLPSVGLLNSGVHSGLLSGVYGSGYPQTLGSSYYVNPFLPITQTPVSDLFVHGQQPYPVVDYSGLLQVLGGGGLGSSVYPTVPLPVVSGGIFGNKELLQDYVVGNQIPFVYQKGVGKGVGQWPLMIPSVYESYKHGYGFQQPSLLQSSLYSGIPQVVY